MAKNVCSIIVLFLVATNRLVVTTNEQARKTYILATDPASTQATSLCQNDRNSTVARCLTFNELITSVPTGQSAFESGEEVIFQSGTHAVQEINGTHLEVIEVKQISLNGESGNVTIKCNEEFYMNFSNTAAIKLSNFKLVNCTRTFSQSKPGRTILFENTWGNITINNVQIKCSSQSRIDILVNELPLHIELNHVKLFQISFLTESGLYGFHGERVKVEIMNSKFQDSCIEMGTSTEEMTTPALTIRNTTLNGSNCQSAINIATSVETSSIVLHNIKITHVESLYVIEADRAVIILKGANYFQYNEGAIYIQEGRINFHGTLTEFVNNTIINKLGVVLHAKHSTLFFSNSLVVFQDNYGSQTGGITATDMSQIFIRPNTTIKFVNNEGEKGGAVRLSKQSVVTFDTAWSNQSIRLEFMSNLALYGGGIYVKDKHYLTIDQKLSNSVFNGAKTERTRLVFANNRAQVGGNQIYGGWVDWRVKHGSIEYNENISAILEFRDDTDVASDPTRVCMCMDGFPNCNTTEYKKNIHGHLLSIELVAVGQRGGRVIAFVEASFKDKSGNHQVKLKKEQKFQTVQRKCTTLTYTIISTSSEVTVTFKPLQKNFLHIDAEELKKYPEQAILFEQLSVHVNMHSCPIGFVLHDIDQHCSCRRSVSELGLKCDLNSYGIKRTQQQWVGVTYEHTLAGENPGLISHNHCPFDYCRRDNESLIIHLEQKANQQCAHNHSGTLCGSCIANFSRVLGSSRCKICSNDYKTSIIAILTFLLSGLLLVTMLMLLNLTVSVGTINGLIFHVNIIRAQHNVFFSPDTSSSFLSVFIAWLNLDQGIEICLYNGFDAYTSTWLQFLFPVYIWLIAAALVVSSHYSYRISKLVGKNTVPVLATLFLISYAKLLRLIINVFSFTTIKYPDGYQKKVWLVDGNVEYLKGKHIPLFLVTVIFLTVSLPYTFILLTIQLLYKVSQFRIMFWVQRLKPFFDAYTGPYKPNHRYWTGLLLVARILLLLIFSVNGNADTSINMVAIITVFTLLLGWSTSVHWVYESGLNNFLETVFFTNMIITTAAVFYNQSNKINSPVAIYISTSITLLIFVGIVLYHIQRRLILTKCGSRIKTRLSTAISKKLYDRTFEEDNMDEVLEGSRDRSVNSPIPVSFDKIYEAHSGGDLKEPLLED